MLYAVAMLASVALALVNAFFVAAEFAIVKIRLLRLEQLAARGQRRARVARGIARRLDAYLSANQLGITRGSCCRCGLLLQRMPCSLSLMKERVMVLIPVRCLYCQSDQVTKRGKTKTAKQRYRCHNPDCAHQSFLLDPAYKGRLPEVKQQVIEMSLNASGIRDIARVLQISTSTVLNELKKRACAHIRA